MSEEIILVSVPLEPTKEMILAGDDAAEECKDWTWDSGGDGESSNTYEYLRSDAPAYIYKAMVKAYLESVAGAAS